MPDEVKEEFSDCEGGVDIDASSPSFEIDVKVELHEDEKVINKKVKKSKRKATKMDHQSAGAKAAKVSQPKEYEYDPEWSLVSEQEFHQMAKNERPRVCPRCHVTYPR